MLSWIKTVIHAIGYSGVALLMILENVFPPIPSEIIMPFAGFLSSQGELSFAGVVIAGVAGTIIGTLPFYYLGYKIGQERLARWADEHGHWLMLSSKDIERAQSWFDRHGKMAVLLCRLVPGVRTLISVPAGIDGMNISTYLLLTLIGTSVWVGVLTYLGRLLGQNYSTVGKYINPASYIVMGGLLIWYMVYIIRRKRGKNK